jgi:hypothetical protein
MVTFTKVPHHTYARKGSDGVSFIDRDLHGWKLWSPKTGTWAYYSTFEQAFAAAQP